MKNMCIIGANQQFVKYAPLSGKLKMKHEEILAHTGQHYDAVMLDPIFVLTRNVNDFMPVYIYDLTEVALARTGKCRQGR